MKLRDGFALAVAVTTTVSLAAASALTLAIFIRAQERALDRSLLDRARIEAEEALELGGTRLNIEQTPSDEDDELDQLVKYGAMYRRDGRLLDDTATFPERPPRLAELDWAPHQPLPEGGFDLRFKEQSLRAVLVPVGASGDPEAHILLLAASRRDMDNDARSLAKLMAMMVVLAGLSSLLLGRFIGARMTRGVESIAAVARRIAAGELDARVEAPLAGPQDETRRLGLDLNAMVDRLSALIDSERRFASYAAHELRSPLAALRGELELALRRPRTEEAYKDAISAALDDTDRLIALAEDLLVFARSSVASENGYELANVREILERAVADSLARAAQQRVVEVQVSDEPTIRARSRDLTRMVRNLVDNAVAHSPATAAVRVLGRRSNDDSSVIELVVENEGAGIPEDLRERIFEPFTRGDESRERSGAGLGLAIARQIAKAHGGDVMLESSRALTRFVARFPA